MELWHVLGALGGQLLVAGAIYGGIRADLRHMQEQLRAQSDSIEHAHSRIDSLLLERQR